MNDEWKIYWISNIINNNYNIVLIEKNTTLIYINTTSMKMSSRNVRKS